MFLYLFAIIIGIECDTVHLDRSASAVDRPAKTAPIEDE